MELAFKVAAIIIGLFLGMLLFAEFGRRLGRARRARDPEGLAADWLDSNWRSRSSNHADFEHMFVS